MPIAGGTELLKWFRLGIASPNQVIDIGRLKGLDRISRSGGRLSIGALAFPPHAGGGVHRSGPAGSGSPTPPRSRGLTIWNSTQASFNAPPVIAAALGLKPSDIRQIAPHTGGGFGAKGGVWPHEILAAAAARVTGRPVRLHLTRSQMYQVGHQPEFRQVVTLGATADGKLTAMRHEAINTTSASDTHSEAPTASARGSYACPNIAVDHQLERINFGVPCPMRAPVEGPGSWAFESAMDELAVKLGIDPLDLRLANHAEVHPMDGRPWSSNKLREAYAEADQAYGWRTRRSRPRQDGVWQIGHVLRTYGEQRAGADSGQRPGHDQGRLHILDGLEGGAAAQA